MNEFTAGGENQAGRLEAALADLNRAVAVAAGASAILKVPHPRGSSPLNVLKDTYDHSFY